MITRRQFLKLAGVAAVVSWGLCPLADRTSRRALRENVAQTAYPRGLRDRALRPRKLHGLLSVTGRNGRRHERTRLGRAAAAAVVAHRSFLE